MNLEQIISRDPEVMSGELVFTGTRVPAHSLIDHLKAGDSIEDFLDGFPSVSRQQSEAFLELLLSSFDSTIISKTAPIDTNHARTTRRTTRPKAQAPVLA